MFGHKAIFHMKVKCTVNYIEKHAVDFKVCMQTCTKNLDDKPAWEKVRPGPYTHDRWGAISFADMSERNGLPPM